MPAGLEELAGPAHAAGKRPVTCHMAPPKEPMQGMLPGGGWVELEELGEGVDGAGVDGLRHR